MRPSDDSPVQGRLQKALDALVAASSPLPAAGTTTAKPVAPTPPPSSNAPQPARPWDRGDLFRRLQTFRASTWFAKPPAAGPVPCARRGWVNTGADMLTCETCRHKLHFPLPPDLPLDEVAAAATDFAARLVTAHRPDCAWRTGAAADPGALAFPPLPAGEAVREWRARADSGLELDCLPAVEGVDAIAAAYPARLAALLERGVVVGDEEGGAAARGVLPRPPPLASILDAATPLARSGTPSFHARRRLLALLGWEVRFVNPAAVKLRAAAAAAAADAAAAAAARETLAAGPGAPLPPLKLPPPRDPRAPVLPPGSLRACDALLACDTCGASVGLWSHVPPGGVPVGPSAPPPLALATLGRRGSSLEAGARPRSASLDLLTSTPLSAGRTIAGGLLASPGGGGGDDNPPPGSPGPPGGHAAAQPPVFGLVAFRRRSMSSGGSPTPAPAPAPAPQPPAKRTRSGLRSGGPPAAGPPSPAGPSPALVAAAVGAATSVAWPPAGAGVAAEPVALDPVAAHRRWCPWVNHAAGVAGSATPAPRTGWRWTLPLLVPVPGPEEELGKRVVEAAAAADHEDEPGDGEEEGGGVAADPAARLRAAMLQAGL